VLSLTHLFEILPLVVNLVMPCTYATSEGIDMSGLLPSASVSGTTMVMGWMNLSTGVQTIGV